MWIHRILVLLLLQRVLGHTLSRYEPQESEVYELRQDKDKNTVQFVYPKSSVPKLREIIYYHIIEKPYQTPAEETPKELTSESETQRMPTNTHGYQFLDSLLVDYDTATQETKNTPEELYGDDGNVYKAPIAEDAQYEENPEDYPTDDAEAYEVVEEPVEAVEQEEAVETAEQEEGTVLEDQTNSEDIDDNVEAEAVADETEAEIEETNVNTDVSEDGTDVAEDGSDVVEDDTIESETDTGITEDTNDEISADVVAETTEPMAVEASEIPEEEQLAMDEVVKSLEARNQLFGSPELLRERMMKVRNYLPHLHPKNSHFEPEVVGSTLRRRRRRSVEEKRNARRRRSVLYIYPQGRSLSEPYDESNIPQAPTLSPMDTEGLPSFIKSEMNPENDANSELDPEAPETVPEDSAFVPPPNTYGVKLDNGDGYVWNTLYGSASSEPGAIGEELYTTPLSEPYAEETPDVPKLEEETNEEPALVEVPSDSEIPEESLLETPNEETGAENTEDSYAEEPAESFDDAGEIPAEDGTDESLGDGENEEVSLPDEMDQITIMEELPAEEISTVNPQDDIEQRLAEIFDSLRDSVKRGDQALIHKEIESGIHEYLEAEKDMLARDPDALAIEDDVVEEEKDKLIGADEIALEASDVEVGPVLPEQHGTYGFRLIGDQGEVWNDFTGVRYHVGNDEPTSDNFDDLDTGFDSFNKPEEDTKPILEPFDANVDANFEFDKPDETSDENFTSANDMGLNDDIFSKIIENLKNLTQKTIDHQVSTAVPESSGSLEQSSVFLSLLQDENYRHWIQEWTLEYTRFLTEYINDTFHAAIAERKEEVREEQIEDAKEEELEEENTTARLYINDEELKQSPEVETIINSISDKYLKRRRKHCKKPESTAEVTADNIYGGSSNSGKVVNVFIFFTEEQGKEILDFIKPESTDAVIDSESPDTSDEDYKPDESELDDDESEEDSEAPTETDVEFLQTEAPNIEEGEIETGDAPIDEINKEVLEPVEITTELGADTSDFEYVPEENLGEPEIVEEPTIAEEPEPIEGEETLSERKEAAEEPILDEVTTDDILAEDTTRSDIEENTSDIEGKAIVTDEVLDVPEGAEDEKPVQESELPEEEETIEEVVEVTEPIEGEDVVEVTEPIEDEEIEASEPTEEIEAAVPIEDEAEESTEPIPEEVEQHMDEDIADAEPTEESVVDEPLEEAVDESEPMREEEDAEHKEAAETESAPLEDVVDVTEPVAADVETTEAVDDQVVEDEPLDEQVQVTETADDVEEEVSEPKEQAKVVSELPVEE